MSPFPLEMGAWDRPSDPVVTGQRAEACRSSFVRIRFDTSAKRCGCFANLDQGHDAVEDLGGASRLTKPWNPSQP